MKFKQFTMLTLGASTLIGSVSANADVSTSNMTSTSSWYATATVETTPKLSIVQSKQTLSFVYNSVTKNFSTDQDELTAILRADSDNDPTTGLVVNARLKANTLTNGDKTLQVKAVFAGKEITSTSQSIFESTKGVNQTFGSLNAVEGDFKTGATSTETVVFTIPQQTEAPTEGKYTGNVEIEFNTTWTHGAA